MRTKIDPENKDLFRLRLKEKDEQREELFDSDSAIGREYQHKQVSENPKRIKVGKPAFKPRFK
jgi:hypothetical protein